ncbi:Lipoprotein signal peptidase [Candidatus Rhodobacter oscarellae]|uniref:Lipoprotein signal peptidase n=1 Tax=Candidatus Rhodobacter oscarellae TaxID=1675527 RepID=A0A0J9EC09_9RHOB|nr:signal peptidase II [Candidatus Rhodobacter lobularis]KMW60156.1 Lipoprotein signal peptidase [Candidatus Rhodobacter lobularis]
MSRMYLIALAVFLLDQASKYYILYVVHLDTLRFVEVFPPYLNWAMAWNTGINFGLLSGDSPVTKWVLIAVALLVTGWVAWWMTHPHRPMARIFAGLLIGGALGNVVDRLLYGAVADFLNMSCCGFDNPFSYNVADIAVFAGAIGLIVFTGEKKSA